MIDVNNYFENFKPSFDKERFKELIKNPPKYLQSPKGEIIIDKRFFKSVLSACKMLLKEFDRNHIYYGGEGSGKSHTAFQHAFIWHWCLKELGMINYDFILENIVYGRIKDIMNAFDNYKNIPYMIYVLDESEELNRKNWNKPEVKEFMAKLRRERKNLRIVNLILPALEEILPSIALSRINWILEIEVKIDKELNPIRGQYKLFNIPIGNSYFSSMQGKLLYKKEIKTYLNARFYDNDKKFEELPRKLLAFDAYTNKTFVFDKQEYRDWATKVNLRADAEENELSDRDKKVMNQRDILISYCVKELGIKQTILSNMIGLARSQVGEISRSVGGTQTTT